MINRFRREIIAVVCVVLMLAACGRRAQAAAADAVQTPATRPVVAGKVVGADGKPVGGAAVFVTRYDEKLNQMVVAGKGQSGDDGTFLFTADNWPADTG